MYLPGNPLDNVDVVKTAFANRVPYLEEVPRK